MLLDATSRRIVRYSQQYLQSFTHRKESWSCLNATLHRSFATQTSKANTVPNDLQYVRNIGIIAHIDAGKTTTTERMLYYSGMTHRIGDVDDGSTIMDYLPAERARGITITSATITFNWPPLPSPKSSSTATTASRPTHTINLIDTPGHADFTFEVERSIRVLDGAVTVLDGVAGVEAQTEKVWRQADRYSIPRIIFVNKLDREGAEFGRVVKEIAMRLCVMPAVVQIPLLEVEKEDQQRLGEEVFIGVVDVVNMTVTRWDKGSDGRNMHTLPVLELKETHPKIYNEAQKARVGLVDVLSTVDDILVERFLEVEDAQQIQAEDIQKSLRFCTLTKSTRVIPVLAGAAFRNMGVQPLLDAVLDYLPSPMEAGKNQIVVSVQGERSLITADQAGNVCALAFKVVHDEKRGVLVYVRVYSGVLRKGANIFNTNLQTKEKAQRLLRMYANEPHDIDAIPTGHIGVIVGLKYARTGDTLVNATTIQGHTTAGIITKHHKREKKFHKKHEKLQKDHDPLTDASLQLRPIDVPPPVFFASLEPASLSEQRNVEEALAILLREDPSLHTSIDEDSGQTLLSGMGELHLEISKDRLVKDLKAKAKMGSIRIGYREVVAKRVENVRRDYERTTGDRKSIASVSVTVEAIKEYEEPEPLNDNVVSSTTLDGNEIIVEMYSSAQSSSLSSSPSSPSSSDTNNIHVPGDLTVDTLANAITTGALTALSRGPSLNYPMHSTRVTISINTDTDFPSGPDSTLSTFTSATRAATIVALKQAGSVLMEPVMNVVITVDETDLGVVVGDISSGAGGGTVLSLDDDADDVASSGSTSSDVRHSTSYDTNSSSNHIHNDMTDGAGDNSILPPLPIDVSKVYAPPDSYLANAIASDHGGARGGNSGGGGASGGNSGGLQMNKPRAIRARVPLKKMVGYMNHLRSLTKGRGTFVMSVDRFERMSDVRIRAVMMEMRGEF